MLLWSAARPENGTRGQGGGNLMGLDMEQKKQVRAHGWPWSDLRQHPRHDRQHAEHPDQQPRAEHVAPLREGGVLQPGRVGQGSPGGEHHRGGRADGALKPGQTVVEATSGNTGIGLAMVCAAKGYPLVVTMADSFSIERRQLMRFLGAKVVLTPRAQKGTGMYMKAKELADAERLVPRPPVRDRSQRQDPREHHGAGDHRRFRRATGWTTS